MTVTVADIRTATDEAKRGALLLELLGQHSTVLGELRAKGESIDGLKVQIDKMIPEITEANALVREAKAEAMGRALTGPESELRSYVEPSGKIRMLGRATDSDLWRPGLLDDTATHGEWHGRMKELYGQRTLVRMVRGDSPKVDREIQRHRSMAPSHIRAAFGDSNHDDWLPTENFSPDLELALITRAEGTIAAQFRTVPMTRGSITMPFGDVGGVPYLQGAVVADPAQYTKSLPDIAKRTKTAAKMAMRSQLDSDSAEDSIVDAYSTLIEMMANDLLDGEEDAIINGDTTASHGDTGITAWSPNGRWGDPASVTFGGTADHRRAWIGLRHFAIDIGATAWVDLGSAQTFDGLASLRGRLAARSHNDTIGICSAKFMYSKIVSFSQVQKSDSVVGQVATDGRVMSLAGAGLFLSPFMDDELNASGVFDNSTKTKSGFLWVNRSAWRRYVRRGATTEIAKDITRGVTDIVSTSRTFFGTNHTGKRVVVYGYNITG